MKLDTVIKKRFGELSVKAQQVTSTRRPSKSGLYEFFDDEIFNEWAISVLGLFHSVFGENGPYYNNFSKYYTKAASGHFSDFEKCKGIFQAAKSDYESGYLFSIRGLIKAEDSADILDQATELLEAGYKDPACVIAGVALEIALKELCVRSDLPHGNMNTMNVELYKKTVYNLGMQKQITAWAHWRNKAAHGEWDEYEVSQVEEMIRGVTRFVAEYLL